MPESEEGSVEEIESEGDEEEEPLILHAFADYGTESEVLCGFGDVMRVGINSKNTNDSMPMVADAFILAEDYEGYFPFEDEVRFDLGVFHPVCTKWAATTSISGDPDEEVDMIPSARELAMRFCDHYVIENVPRAPLRDPVVLDGRMFGLPIKYERAFETSFNVPQPPRYKRFWSEEGDQKKVETSSFYFSERSKKWWASVKGYPPEPYTKQHLAKNTIPAPYIHHIARAWLKVYEEEEGISADRVDYSNYDERMERMRRQETNYRLTSFMPGSSDE